MANSRYGRNSPWYQTNEEPFYLDILTPRPIPVSNTDYTYEIEAKFRHRPDLLAYELFGDAGLWWVFAQRNMSILKDPVYDFESGLVIKIPMRDNLQAFLGLA